MPEAQLLFDHFLPLLCDLGPGPLWLSVHDQPENGPVYHEVPWENLTAVPEQAVLFEVHYSGFSAWEPAPDCRAVVLIGPSFLTAVQPPMRRRRPLGGLTDGSTYNRLGCIYLAVCRDGDSYAMHVGEDGQYVAGEPIGGDFLDVARSKLGLRAGPPTAYSLLLAPGQTRTGHVTVPAK